MKYRLITLVLSLVVSQMAWGADAKEKTLSVEGVEALPFEQIAPLPGALTISGDGRIAAHIGINGDIVVWDATKITTLETIAGDATPEKKPSAIALSPDGSMLAIGYFDSRLIIWSRLEKKPLREFYGHSGGSFVLDDFSPDGKPYYGGSGGIFALAFSPDGQMLASGAGDATTQLWEVSTGKRLHIFDSMRSYDGTTGIPISIGVFGNGQALFVNEWHLHRYDSEQGITIWDIEDGIEISTRDSISLSDDSIMSVGQALGGKGWLLAYITGKNRLVVERLDRCESPRKLPFGDGYATTTAADPLGRWAAIIKAEWETKGGKITFFGTGSDEKAYAIALPASTIALVPHPDGRSVFALMIADIGNDYGHFIFGRRPEIVMTSALYRIPVPEPLWRSSPPLNIKEDATHCAPTEAIRRQQDFKLPEQPVELTVTARLVPAKEIYPRYLPRNLYFSKDWNLYVLYSHEYNYETTGVAIWSLQTSRLLRGRFEPNSVGGIVQLRKGWGEFVGGTPTLTDLLTGKRLFSVPNVNDKYPYLTFKYDPDTGQFFRLTAKKQIEHYSADGRRLPDIATQESVVNYAVRNGRLAALYGDGSVQVWQLEPRGKSKTYKLTHGPGYAEELALSADGRYLEVSYEGHDENVYITYRLSSGEPVSHSGLLSPFPAHANRGVVADTRPHRLAVWDFDKNEIIARLPRQRSRDKDGAYHPLRAALSDDGRLVASASYDGLIRVWDIDAHQMLGEGRTGGEVTAIVFDSTGKRLAAGRGDGQIIVFQIPVPE